VLGAAVGLAAAGVLGAAHDGISAGLFGFSAVLTSIAPGSVFTHPRPGWPGNVARVVFTVVVQGALNVMLEPLGIPTLTACVRAGDLALPAAESGASSAPCLAVCRGMLAHVRRPDPSRESSAGWSGIHCDSPYPTSASQPGGSVSGLRAPHPRWSYEPAARLILPGAACR
jgi:hypothetical protein